ncbi:MAG TPA: glycosyltransferase family protein [Verrucomicrobiae bacterium]|jgi:uncharacterized protein (TIGR00661 family)|nr:glycosyltransferase family protein [Verrucomicrobiae bacterium]
MFSILGEGRGHMTQAMAVKEMAEKAGHEVTCVALGMGPNRTPPAYFAAAMAVPTVVIPTLDFSFKNNRSVNLPGTVAGIMRRIPAYRRGVGELQSVVRKHRPDVIVNFFESLTGIYAMTCRHRPPVVAVAHQFMFGHPDYVRARGMRLQQLAMKRLVQIAGAASTRLALSLYEAQDLPRKKLTVCPPILRRQLFSLRPNPKGDFVLVYLLNHGYADQILAWHKKNPQTALHCFYDKPDAPPEFRHDETLTFHRLDGEKFLRMMADCKYVACTAGFESLAEAAYLGKPLFLVPVENHVEQQINAIDAVKTGLGVADKSFNLDRLAELPDRLDNAKYLAWLNRAESIFLETLDRVLQKSRGESSRVFDLKA